MAHSVLESVCHMDDLKKSVFPAWDEATKKLRCTFMVACRMDNTYHLPMSLRILILLPSLLLVLPAAAQEGRIVVLPFEGRGPTGPARMSLVRPLMQADDISLMRQADYVAQARAAGVAPGQIATSEGVRKVAAITGVDGVLVGRTFRRNERWHVRISYFDSDGTRAVHRNYPLVQGRLRPNDRNRIVRGVTQRAINMAAARAEEDQLPVADLTSETEEPTEAIGPSSTEDHVAMAPSYPPQQSPTEAPPAVDWSARPAPSAATDDPGKSPRSPKSGVVSPLRPLATVLMVGGGTTRTYQMEGSYLRITYETGRAPSGGGLPLFPELGVMIESFPFKSHGEELGGLGLEAGFSRGFITTFFTVDDISERQDTPVWRGHLDGRWRRSISSTSPFSPELGVRAGVGYSGFVATSEDVPFIGVSHTTLRAGAEAVQPLVPSHLWLHTWVVAIPLAMPGEQEKDAFGSATKARGWAARLGLSGTIGVADNALRWSAWIDRQAIGTQFEGEGSRHDGGESEEVYLAFQAALGLLF